MDEANKREKIKRTKTDHVKNIVQAYLQRRNYGSIHFLENTKISDQITYSTIETQVSQTNSILYSCHNNDPVAIDQNFTKFMLWLKDLTKNKNTCHDLEALVGPLFCHLYLDLLKGTNSERAATFLKIHLPSIDRTKCDSFVKDLINLIASDSDATCLKEQFRSNKYYIELSPESIKQLHKFVSDNCHIVLLHILKTWFDFNESSEEDTKMDEKIESEQKVTNGICSDDKSRKILDAIDDLNKEPKQIFTLNITCTKEPVNCGFISRKFNIVGYNQSNRVHLRPINSFDNVMGHNYKEIQLIDHSKPVTCIDLAQNSSIIVTGSLDCTVCFYSVETMELLRKCSGHQGPINCVAVASNNSYVASGSHDSTSRLWCPETGRCLRIFVGHSQAVTSADFHPNCLYLATSSADKTIRMWSVDNGNPLRLFHDAKGIIYSVAFSPLGDCLAGCGDDKKLRVWDVLSSKLIVEFKCKGEALRKLVWSANANELCCGSVDGTVRVWDLTEKDNEGKVQEKITTTCGVNAKLLNLESCFETFACVFSS